MGVSRDKPEDLILEDERLDRYPESKLCLDLGMASLVGSFLGQLTSKALARHGDLIGAGIIDYFVPLGLTSGVILTGYGIF